MLLKSLSLNNFRNHRELKLELPDLLYIMGDNGAGKTSIVESIYLLLTHKTFKSSPLQEICSFKEDYFRIKGDLNGEYDTEAVFFYQQKKQFMLNGDKTENIAMFSYNYPVICYSPYFETVLSVNHKDRRTFLDRISFYTDISYIDTVKKYNSLLARKRAELAKDDVNKEIVVILTEQLLPLSKKISQKRVKLVEDINIYLSSGEEAKHIMPGISLSLSVSNIDSVDIDHEIAAQRPMYGAHKDLLYIKHSGKIIEKFQSFGQKKSALLLLLYYMAKRVEESRKCDIILLLDDFEAGLDGGRVGRLSELFMANNPSGGTRQMVLTGINNSNFKSAETLKL